MGALVFLFASRDPRTKLRVFVNAVDQSRKRDSSLLIIAIAHAWNSALSLDWSIETIFRFLVSSILKVFLFTGVWLWLNEFSLPSLIVGLPAVAVASWIIWPRRKVDKWRWRPLGFPAFAVYFCFESIKGGIDVSRRALARQSSISCGLREFRVSLPAGAPRELLTMVIGLLPGTLVVDVIGDRMIIHALDDSMGMESELRKVENSVAQLFKRSS